MVDHFTAGYLALGILLGFLVTEAVYRRREKKRERESSLLDSITSDEDNAVPSEYAQYRGQELKMILCVRNDLKMGKGKMCAQCGHGVLGLYQRCIRLAFPHLKAWEKAGQRKVVVKVPNEEEMYLIFCKAQEAHIPAFIVHDAGRTQVQAGSATVLAIGPAPDPMLDKLTGHLSLL